ncbi:MAG TPA: glycosyltransferase family protein [Chitinophagaceae bacterium]|nr:glycosyltransferase family protein [Chitinophagaceae bacterium]
MEEKISSASYHLSCGEIYYLMPLSASSSSFNISHKNTLKIFYAVQATGNGHIARAGELMLYLQQYGEVDVFLSGSNSSLAVNLPVKYKSKGLSLFYTKRGGLDYKKIWRELSLKTVHKEAKELPVEKYDIVINDFESITSIACKLKKVKSIGFGHQASFQSDKTPRPKTRSIAGELILQKYATATDYVGLHFEKYDDFIFSPVIKQSILECSPQKKNHITVYLVHYSDEILEQHLSKISDIRFEIFSRNVTARVSKKNLDFIPVSNEAFNNSLINCMGIITGGGFETPAEALYLGKKLMCIPIGGQYEQLCNAVALEKFNVPVLKKIDVHFADTVRKWLAADDAIKLELYNDTAFVVQHVIEKGLKFVI